MSEVHVLLPAEGKMFVDNDPEPVIAGRRIEWRFFSQRPDVDRVAIVFKDEDAKIFKIGGQWQNRLSANLKNNRATIWAEPDRQGVPQKVLKYSVLAWAKPGPKDQFDRGNDTPKLVLDPEIIIDDPGL